MRKIVMGAAALAMVSGLAIGGPASANPVPIKNTHHHISCLKLLTWQEYRKGCPLVPLGATPPPMPGHGAK